MFLVPSFCSLFVQVMDVYYLFMGDMAAIQEPFIQRFENFVKYSEYAKRVNDIDILGKCRIVQKYKSSTAKYVDRIR